MSPDGKTVFVAGSVKTHFETVAYSGATGVRLWATAYKSVSSSNPAAIAVSPDGARVYVTGRTGSAPFRSAATVAYEAGTGTQLWASRYHAAGAYVTALAVSPDGTSVYVTGSGRVSGRQDEFTVIAYASATGKQRWLHRYAKVKPGYAASVAVSPSGKSVYATGAVGSQYSALTVAYDATGTLKWASRYKNPYAGGVAGEQIVTGAGADAVYIVGRATNRSGHSDIATFAYRTATGKRMWLDRYNARAGGGVPPRIAVTPDGRSVIVTGPRNGGHAGGYLLASYSSSTGRTRWMGTAVGPGGLAIKPNGDTLFIGGPPAAAYSVADGTYLWNNSYRAYGASIVGLNGDGTRVFVTGSLPNRGITTIAYHA
jgi:DNA-binding beta-propeller fold protein YncE